MNMAPSAPDPALSEPADPHQERAERHGRMLARLGELALGLAEAVQGQAVEAARRPPEDDAADRTRGLGLVFARLSYEVRQTVALEARLAADSQKAAVERDTAAAQDRWRRRRNLVRRILKEAIEAEEAAEAEACELDVDEQDRRDDLLHELDRRLQDDTAEDIGDLPVGEVVARFCRELDIAPDWSRWRAETWAVEESGHPQSPYPRPPFARPPDAKPEEADAPAEPGHPRPSAVGPLPEKPDSS
ncbi:hypothetical protein [Inquilinus sp. Marseille-Q2685]|uniref:hypothetical protein n=1 Tax=Inquilinus sp. Marseille-Q2685 TaxID=2866581 RepID=UPI001CE3C68A|nr:hypothetical protein [Inquilinus sp. Marseille-Q2685]